MERVLICIKDTLIKFAESKSKCQIKEEELLKLQESNKNLHSKVIIIKFQYFYFYFF